MTEHLWLLQKRGLYYMPNDCGYTGIKNHAGRYNEADARERVGGGVTMIREDLADEFSPMCFDDLARAYLTKDRDRLRAENERLRAALESLTKDPPATLDEPDDDAEVIIKMRAIARDALNIHHHSERET